jgi:predicted alpha/beta-hydrolase family hydrolase
VLWTGPAKSKHATSKLTVILTHGAGAPMDTPFMNFFAEGLGERGYRVGRFEFPYMATRRTDGKRKPPDRQPVLLATWREIITGVTSPVVIGGKSMGGRMASLIADECAVAGLLCLGYPFFGAGRKNTDRIEHLADLKTPTLFCQGTRDPMGNAETVAGLTLSKNIKISWAEDGDHDLKPRKASGRSHDQNLTAALDASARFLAALA